MMGWLGARLTMLRRQQPSDEKTARADHAEVTREIAFQRDRSQAITDRVNRLLDETRRVERLAVGKNDSDRPA